ncbi:MAG TPA: FkbM family methyltransferase [Methylocella sp.]|jgi:FkbM family methyltransferase
MWFKAEITEYLASLLDFRVARKGRVGPLLEDDFLERFFQYFDIDCVFDVGANVGQFARKIRRKLNYKGRIISFEPMPDTAARLRREAENDGLWSVEEVALDNVNRRATFNIMQDTEYSSLRIPECGDIGIHAEPTNIVSTIEVETKTLSEYYKKYKNIYGFYRPYLKIDAQGNDLEIVKGGYDVIRNFVGLQIELAFKRIYAGSASYRDAIDYYESLDFEISALVPNNGGTFPYLYEMDCIMIGKSFLPNSGTAARRPSPGAAFE